MINNNLNNDSLKESNIILELQNYLINIRNTYPSLPVLYPSGVYDKHTKQSVAAFQSIKGLPSTGTVDIITWNALIRENAEYHKRTGYPGRVTVSPPDFVDAKKGDERDIVYAIKVMLNNFYRRYANYNKLEITNIYDGETEEAVSRFQQRSLLPVTGIVDKTTWNTLVTIYGTCKFYL